MNLTSELEHYIEIHCSPEPSLLAKLRKETFRKSIQPHMISGLLQGRILSMLAKIIYPKNILEIGTFTGYSALCLAEGLSNHGRLITIDKNPELEFISKPFLQQEPKIEYMFGDALQIIPTLNTSFDLVFLDADKDNYVQYLDLILTKTHSGSIILADNILWKGKLIDPNCNDKKTKALQEFNQKIVSHSELEVVILPIRDGISIIRRK